MNNIKVSIVCLTYNHVNYIKQAIDSILEQNIDFDYELVIYDDFSNDGTRDILKSYEKNPNIKLFLQNENKYSLGMDTFLEAIKLTKGKYIAICEGDDYWIEKDKLKTQVAILEKNNNIVACGHNVLLVNDKNELLDNKIIKYNLREKKDKVKNITDISLHSRFAHTCSIMFKRNIIFDMKDKEFQDFYNIKANGDEKLSALIAIKGDFYYLAKDFSCYRYVTNSGSSYSAQNNGKNVYLKYMNYILDIEKYTKKHYNISQQYNMRKVGLFFKSVYKYIIKPTTHNFHVMRKIMKNISLTNVLIFFIKIPLLYRRKK